MMTVVTSSNRLNHISFHSSWGSVSGRSEPGYFGNPPRPSTVMKRFAVIFRVMELPRRRRTSCVHHCLRPQEDLLRQRLSNRLVVQEQFPVLKDLRREELEGQLFLHRTPVLGALAPNHRLHDEPVVVRQSLPHELLDEAGPTLAMMFPPFSRFSFATIVARSPFMIREFSQPGDFRRCDRQTLSTRSRYRA